MLQLCLTLDPLLFTNKLMDRSLPWLMDKEHTLSTM